MARLPFPGGRSRNDLYLLVVLVSNMTIKSGKQTEEHCSRFFCPEFLTQIKRAKIAFFFNAAVTRTLLADQHEL